MKHLNSFSRRVFSSSILDSGYPIMTHLDICDPNAQNFIFNRPRLEREGDWGVFHELGHNLQRDWWSKLSKFVD